jgi:chromosome segregation ATPase
VIAAEQRRRRRNPEPPPKPQELIAAEQRLAEVRSALAECDRRLERETSRLHAAEQQIEHASVALREIRADWLRMAREEGELGRLAATEALRLSIANLRRYGRPRPEWESQDQELVDEMETSSVFDPFDLVASPSSAEGNDG